MSQAQAEKHDEKAAFASENEANGAAVLAKSRYVSSQLKPYKCYRCDLWHLASEYSDDE